MMIMGLKMTHFLSLFAAMAFSALMFSSDAQASIHMKGDFKTSPFPRDFLFGAASSAYQFEGSAWSDGKGPSNWDVFTHKPGHIVDGSTGDVADDHYRRYPEDLKLMEHIGVNSFRFSISWARILPKGRFGKVNMAGINHYNRLIDALLLKGMTPFVTLTHYDFPQELERRYGAWLNHEIKEDFVYYAGICFKHFGDRVKFWTTFNEPNVQVIKGYQIGNYPPSRCSKPFGNCTNGDSGTEPFVAAHNMILSHTAAVDLYRSKYQKTQNGKIGIVMCTAWYKPASDSMEDKLAAERAHAFYLRWFLDPIILGEYPKEMQEILGSLLPLFSNEDKKRLKNGLDFIGINQYTSAFAKDCIYSKCDPGHGGSKIEGWVKRSSARDDGVPVGEPTRVNWLYVHPEGMEKIVLYLTERYNNTPIFVTENGFGENSTAIQQNDFQQNDFQRVDYLARYLDSLISAIRKGADVRGYFVWALLDNFEWDSGYTIRFGLYHVDYNTQKRTPRLSAFWYKDFIANYTAQSRLAPEM